MAEWSIAALRTILSTETDADSDLNEELMSQIRENIEAMIMLMFYTGDDGSLTADPPNSTVGTITDSAGGYAPGQYNGCVVVITSGTAEGNIYQIDDTTATTLVCTGDNLYSDGVRSGDTYKVFFDLKNTHGHAHDGIDSAEVELADNQVVIAKMADHSVGEDELVHGSVTSDQLATNSVTTNKIAIDQVDTVHIAANAIGHTEMDNALYSGTIVVVDNESTSYEYTMVFINGVLSTAARTLI